MGDLGVYGWGFEILHWGYMNADWGHAEWREVSRRIRRMERGPHAEFAEWKDFFGTRMFMNVHELIQKFLTTDWTDETNDCGLTQNAQNEKEFLKQDFGEH